MTPEDYLAEQPADRRAALEHVRKLVNQNIAPGFEEGILFGMISWYVPLERYPKTYNKQPLTVVCLGNKKSYMTLHLVAVYVEDWRRGKLEADYQAAGKKLDMGKGCLRFKKLDDLAEEAIGQALREVTVDGFIAAHEASRK